MLINFLVRMLVATMQCKENLNFILFFGGPGNFEKKRIQKQNILAKLKKVSLTALTAQNGQHMIYMFSNAWTS